MHSLERIVTLLSWCSSICPSGMAMHCDQTVHFSADLSLRLDSPMFWTPWHQSMSTCSQPSFSNSTWKRGEVWMCKLGVISQERLKTDVKLLLSERVCRVYHPTQHIVGHFGEENYHWVLIALKLLLSANRKSYMPHWLAQQRMTLSDL